MNVPLPTDTSDFIEAVARLMIPWGIPATTARLYGLLLVCAAPVSLDEIAAALAVSKSGASVAARQLEAMQLALRHGERGSRRVRYEASDRYEGVVAAQNQSVRDLAELIASRGLAVSKGPVAARLDEMVAFYTAMCDTRDAALRDWRARRKG